jgi:hypothetical protein
MIFTMIITNEDFLEMLAEFVLVTKYVSQFVHVDNHKSVFGFKKKLKYMRRAIRNLTKQLETVKRNSLLIEKRKENDK